MDLGASALLVTAAGSVRGDDDFVFYDQPASPDGSVKHAGTIASGGDRLVADAGAVPAQRGASEPRSSAPAVYPARTRAADQAGTPRRARSSGRAGGAPGSYASG